MAKYEKEDIAQDKKIVKKAFKMHDDQLHESKKTDLKKLKKGGTVRRFEKASGQYGAKKNDADIKSIKEAKQVKPVKLCGGSSVKKMQIGGTPAMAPSAPVGQGAISDVEKMRLANRARNRAMLSPMQQKQLDAQEAAAAAAAATGQGMMRRKGGGCVTNKKAGGKACD